MTLLEIKNRFTGTVMFSLMCESFKACVEAAVSSSANLSSANLSGANLYGANLYRAILYRADLYRANLYRANLSGANLSGAKYGDGVPLEAESIQIIGTKYNILIMDTHIKIGCKLYSYEQWSNFTDAEIAEMDSGALEWWNEWRGFVLSVALGHQQRIAERK